MTSDKVIRIGGASGFWGDSSVGAPQLVERGKVDYLVFDYLAELTMSILAAARAKHPDAGWATDFVSVAMRQVLRDVAAQGIRVIANAGGVNPQGCAAALTALAAEQGMPLRIAVVEGDDVMPLLPALREEGVRELQSGLPLPARVLSANAYLGALPIKRALDAGAQIVITGRCVDSAVTLGALLHAFGWREDDCDRLAQGSLAGHIIECGCQATGGLFTDWESVPDWDRIGYPVIECRADGTFVCTKPEGTGGLVSPAVIAEQMLYEIGDPGAYVLPDVVCDFTNVKLTAVGDQRVKVEGARGRPPTDTYKVSATYADGFKSSATLTIVGFDAAKKAERTAHAILARTRAIFERLGLGDYAATHIEALGAETPYGPHAEALATREAVMRLTVAHAKKEALEIFAREIAPAGTSWSPGTTGAGGRPSASPWIKQYAFLLDKRRLTPSVVIDGERTPVSIPVGMPWRASPPVTTAPALSEPNETVEVPLLRIAHGRSGDKGDVSNIGLIARRAELLPWLRAQVTEASVAAYLAHLVKGKVTRYDLPGIGAVNFVCEQALGGGGMASLRNDPLGKGMAQILLSMPVRVPRALLP
jgi:hypothetical protein